MQRPLEESSNLLRWWSIITIFLLASVFTEAAFAGAMLSGVEWARTAHRANAAFLIVATLLAGVASLVTLRRFPQGPRLGLSLMALAVVVFLQAAVGTLSAKGANLLWVHVPLGVALFGFATQAAARARRLRGHDG